MRVSGLPFAFALALPLLLPPEARAHTVGISRGEYRVSGPSLQAELHFARLEMARVVPDLDPDRDGSVSEAELEGAEAALADAVVGGLEVRSTTGSCRGEIGRVALAEPDGVIVRATYLCPAANDVRTLRLGLLASLSLGHRHLARVTAGDADSSSVLFERSPELLLALSPRAAVDRPVAWPFVRLGIEHIVTGYDHLIFLLGLVLVGGRLRSLLLVVTAFTVAHSISLGLAVLGIWAPSPRVVEPAIALSIAYVGVENWFVRNAARRWLLTFPFGLVHGFGFAGALAEISLPKHQVPLALASFNVGVEAGQIATLGLVLPTLLWLGHRPWFAARGVRTVSAAIALAGLAFFVARVG